MANIETDELFDKEIINSVPEVAKHFVDYNEKQWWDSRRFHNNKYEIVACTGTPEDYTYETVNSTNKWKEARRYYNEGADVYVNGERIHFIDHKAVDNAFEVIRNLLINRQSMFWDDDEYLDPEDLKKIEEATRILDQSGFKLNEEWENKVLARCKHGFDPLKIPLLLRPRFLFKAVETDDLPF